MRNRLFFRTAFLMLMSILLLASCNSKPKDREKYLPNITGNAGEVLVVINKGYWEGELGSTLREILAGEYPYLPQREAYFKLFNATPGGFTGSYLLHRNIVIVNVSPEVDTTGIRMSRNSWAKPQIIVTVSATTPEEASELISGNRELIINTIEQAERDRLIASSKKYEEKEVRRLAIFPDRIHHQEEYPGIHVDLTGNHLCQSGHTDFQIPLHRRGAALSRIP